MLGDAENRLKRRQFRMQNLRDRSSTDRSHDMSHSWEDRVELQEQIEVARNSDMPSIDLRIWPVSNSKLVLRLIRRENENG